MMVVCSRGSPTTRPATVRRTVLQFQVLAEAGDLLRQRGGEPFGDRALDDNPPGRHADLALVQVRAERGGVDRVVEIGVGEDDQRVLAAQLEHDPLQVTAGSLGQLAAGGRRAGEVDPPHARVLDELVTDRLGA